MSDSNFAFDFFNNAGWSPVASAGIVGNLYGESGLNPNILGDNGSAYGVAQWHPDRQANFQKVMGVPIKGSSLLQQLHFVNWELNNTESKTGGLLARSSNVYDATKAFMQGFERPANLSSLGTRVGAADKVLSAALGKGSSLLGKAQGALEGAAVSALNTFLPGSGAVLGALGIGGSKSWVEQFQDWLANSHFWQRLAIGVLALIFIGGAIFLLGSRSDTVKTIVKAGAKAAAA